MLHQAVLTDAASNDCPDAYTAHLVLSLILLCDLLPWSQACEGLFCWLLAILEQSLSGIRPSLQLVKQVIFWIYVLCQAGQDRHPTTEVGQEAASWNQAD